MSKKSRNEVSEFREKFLSKRCFLVDKDDLSWRLIRKILFDPIDSEEPDAYSIVDEGIYLIEHFQFDASIETRDGSLLSIELAKAQNKEFAYILPKSDKIYCIKNLIKHFEEHAKKYEKYKENTLKRLDCKSEFKGLVFLIEDKTIFGAIDGDVLNTYNKEIPFEFVLTSEFINVWKKYDFVKYIVIGGRCHNDDYCIIYPNICMGFQCDSIINRSVFIMNQAAQRLVKVIDNQSE